MVKLRIMVVEDEPIASMDIQSCLEDLGYEVPAVAASGAEAIRLAARISLDLILMDITLNGTMTGIEAAGQIRIAQNIPVIFLTAHHDEDTLALAKTAEPAGFLNKPCDRDSLRITIEAALNSGRDQPCP
jgi:CheY-like chemotaxis protein